MFKWFRHLRISLAAKCQILFGTAGALIITVALYLPWVRMEGMMRDLNLQTSEGIAAQAKLEHISHERDKPRLREAPAQAVSPAALPATEPASRPTVADEDAAIAGYMAPRLIPIHPPKTMQLGRFDASALRQFINDPDQVHIPAEYRLKGVDRYRLAMPLYDEPSCLNCHAADAAVQPTGAPLPTTLPAVRKLLGMVVVDIPSQVNENALFLNRLFILLAALIAGTLTIGVLYVIVTGLILQPVRVLQETAEKVSEGDLNIRSDISTGDEFQQLSETFNIMLVNLKSSDEQLRSSNKALDLKLGQLAETNVALYESNRLKSEFLANVSHELRTPLNSILGFAELLRETVGANPDAKAVRYLQNILGAGRNLLELINDLLDLAKIEAGRMDVRSEPLVLSDVFEGLINLLKPLAEAKNLEISPVVAAGVPIIQSDPAKVQQVLYNLLANAIKFSPIDGHVDLTAQCEGDDRVRISVVDRGPGIELDKQDVIFEKFRQIDGSVTREHSGTGLGLAISRELMSLLGGSIGVQSVLGQGATFWIVLPLKTQPGQRDVREKMVLS
jgi:signal transduction histidine kinase